MKKIITDLNKKARITVGARLDFARDHRGITLIALIITIIVLLILAGVALNFTIGENGILKHTEFASNKYQNSAEKEANELAQLDDYIQNSRETVTIDKAEYEDMKSKINQLYNSSIKYIDYNNIIEKSENTSESETSELIYTLTQDAAVYVAAYPNESAKKFNIYINNKEVRTYWNGYSYSIVCEDTFHLKKGDTIKITGRQCNYIVYGYR